MPRRPNLPMNWDEMRSASTKETRDLVFGKISASMSKWQQLSYQAGIIYAHDDLSPFNGPTIFRLRMLACHLFEDYKAKVEEYRAAGDCYEKARVKVRKEFGYIDRHKELEHQQIFRTASWIDGQRAYERAADRRRRRSKKMSKFNEAMRGLPATAPADVVLDWIAAHPAMMRQARMEEGDASLLLTIDDVIRPPHGKAPCRLAVNQLQYAMASPDKFYAKILERQIKAKPAQVANEVIDDLGDLDDMLASFRAGNDPKKKGGK